MDAKYRYGVGSVAWMINLDTENIAINNLTNS